MALKFRVPGIFTNPADLTVRRDDPILPATGALVLADVAMLADTGVPTAFPNIAAAQAATVLNVAESTLNMVAGFKGVNPAGKYLMNRSGKGGLAGIFTGTMAPYPNAGYAIDLPPKVLDHIYANPTHKIYYSVWGRPTRLGSVQSGPLVVGESQTVYHNYMYSGGINPNADRLSNPGYYDAAGVLGKPVHYANAPAVMTGAANRAAAQGQIKWGNTATLEPVWKPLSWVFYRAYVEDLTISGRSVSAVKALDAAAFAEAFAIGGRFDADTYTDPATIA